MIRASALYMAVIISICIVLLCGSIILIADIYNLQNKKQERVQNLENNLSSGQAILLDDSFKADTMISASLFEKGNDSVSLEKRYWGIYQLGLVKTWINGDTLSKAFFIGFKSSDSLKVLYLADQGRPLTLSGSTRISGTAYLPRSGVKAGFVEGSNYIDKTLIYGQIRDSGKDLPVPDNGTLVYIRSLLNGSENTDHVEKDSLLNSFLNPVVRFHAGLHSSDLSGKVIKGRVIISSDTTLVVDQSTVLEKAILVAPSILIRSGFKGNLQAIAADSITVGDQVTLSYPSALVVLKNDTAKQQVKITIGKGCELEGQLFTFGKLEDGSLPLITIAAGTTIKGEIYSKGYLAMSKTAAIYGSVSVLRFMARVSSSLYENYLIDVKLERPGLSRYYMSSKLFDSKSAKGGVLCWLK